MADFLIKNLAQYTTLDPGGGYAGVGIDNRGFPHFAYTRPGASPRIIYHTYLGRDSGGWVTHEISTTTSRPQFAMIGRDSSGNPSIIWMDGNDSLFQRGRMFHNVRTGAYNSWNGNLIGETLPTNEFYIPPSMDVHKGTAGVWADGEVEVACAKRINAPIYWDLKARHAYVNLPAAWAGPWDSPTALNVMTTGISGTVFQRKKHISLADPSTQYPYILTAVFSNLQMTFYDGASFMGNELVASGLNPQTDTINACFSTDNYLVVVYSDNNNIYLATRKTKAHTPVGSNYDVVTVATGVDARFLTVKVTSNNDIIIGATENSSSQWKVRCYWVRGARPWTSATITSQLVESSAVTTRAWGMHDMALDQNDFPHFVYPMNGGIAGAGTDWYRYARFMGNIASYTKGIYQRIAGTPDENARWSMDSNVSSALQARFQNVPPSAINGKVVLVDPEDEYAIARVKTSAGDKGILRYKVGTI